MQAGCEFLILGGIADEAGVELDGASRCQRRQILDEDVGNSGPAQECQRNLAFRSVDGVDADRRRTVMLHGLEALHAAQVVVSEGRVRNDRFRHVCPAEVCPAEVRLAEVRAAEVRAAEVRAPEVRLDEVCPAEVRLDEVCPAEVCPAEVRLDEVRPAEIRDYFGVCLPPVIPSLYAFLDFCEMFTVRHGASLSLALIIPRRGEGGKTSYEKCEGASR